MSAIQTPEKPARAEPLLELKADADRRGQVDSRIPVRWCVGKPMLQAIEARGFRNPYIVIVVRNRKNTNEYGQDVREWVDTAIYAAPLTQEMQFISFTRPGRNDVRAFVVEMNGETAKWLRLTRRMISNDYSGSILSDTGRLIETVRYRGSGKHEESFRSKYFDTSARVRVMVPEEMFASEPAPWRKALVAAFFSSKGRDQCGFRRRFWFVALPLTLLGAPIYAYVMKFAFLVALLLFGRLPNKGFWKTAGQPFNFTSWMDTLSGFSPSKWWHGRQAIVLGALNPPVLLALPSLLFVLEQIPLRRYHVNGHLHHRAIGSMSWPQMAAWVDGVLAGIIAAIAVVVVLVYVLSVLIGWLVDRFPKQTTLLAKLVLEPIQWTKSSWSDWRRNVAAKRREEDRLAILQLESELVAMTCRSEAMQVSVKALPKEKQTVYLRFNDFKTKVCKPFAA